MKIKRIKKKCGDYPFFHFTTKVKGLKMVASIYEDGGGYYSVPKLLYNDEDEWFRDDGKIKNWIEDLESKIKNLKTLKDFLKDVEYKIKMDYSEPWEK